jgi:hypothetical protein
MKWHRRGQIFDFDTSAFCTDYVGFAQSPQVLDCGDCVRIYFSTRKQSAEGKFVSIIQYIEMDPDFCRVLRRSNHSVVPLGELGTFDEHGIFPFSVFRHGNAVWGYSNGWSRRKSVSVETSIGLAQSGDQGLTFQKYGKGPVLTASLHEPYLVCDPFVRVFQGVFHMWYIYGTDWHAHPDGREPDRTYVIAHATSDDGVHWQKEGRPLLPQLHALECQALPSVIQIGTRYHMVFCHRHTFDFRTNPARGYRLGYAYSDDLQHWIRDDSSMQFDAPAQAWEAQMMCYPHLFAKDKQVYLLYNGNAFGRHGFGLAELSQD